MHKVTLQFRSKAEADLWLNSLDNDHDTLGEIGENTYAVLLSKRVLRADMRGKLINKKWAGTLTHWERRWLQLVQPEGDWG